MPSTRLLLLGLVIVLVGLVVTPFVVLSRVSGQHTGAARIPVVRRSTALPVSNPKPVVQVTPVDPTLLPLVRFHTLTAQMDSLVARHDPPFALARLAYLMRTDPAVLRSCHGLAHEIGRAAYRRYRDFGAAMRYQDDICGSGYLHGVIEEAFQHIPDPYAAMQTICNQYTGAPLLGKCYHGVGHGLMLYTRNNVPLALNMCSTYFDNTAKVRCSEGVFMENFNTDTQVHVSAYLRPHDPLFPCAGQILLFQGACYFYAPDYYLDLHDRDYLGALRECVHAQPGWESTCINGVGSRTMKQNLSAPHFVERICDLAPAGTTAPCIDGMVSYYLVNFYSVAKTNQMCAGLLAADVPACDAAVSKRANIFAP